MHHSHWPRCLSVRNFGGEVNQSFESPFLEEDYEDANDWLAVHVQGEIYPRIQLRIVRGKSKFYLVNETGWNGFREVLPHSIGSYNTYESAAAVRADLIEKHAPIS